jgi:2-methylisocitrate lyase-like PEP mutase family enzyme
VAVVTAQLEKWRIFQKLHEQSGAFVIPNPWDAGSARILTALGFGALATTSAGFALSIGRRDGEGALTRDETLGNAKAIVAATHLPVSADLENGFGDAPGDCSETVRCAVEAGLVGGSIEDASGDLRRPIYEFQHAVERVAAAAETARSRPFVLTARAENFLHGRPDLDDTIKRLRAFEAAGAQVLYAPGLPSLDAIRLVCSAVKRPVNVVVGLSGPLFTLGELEAVGVKRVSVGSAFARAAWGGLVRAAREVKEEGTFTFSMLAIPFAEVNDYMPRT